ncbi:hypothetical protein SUGI_0253650 [Cryptomeria japonica]|nr:hypothetical protein SUGI_0253650 [Cryptomeria japonica]
MMKHLEILVTLLCFMVVGLESSMGARLLVENEWENLPAMDFHLHVGAHTTGVPCFDAGIRTSEESAKDEEVMGKTFPCGLGEQRLSTSKPSPSVGHMQIYNIANSGQTSEVGHQEQDAYSQKRVLSSTPSPGAGH